MNTTQIANGKRKVAVVAAPGEREAIGRPVEWAIGRLIGILRERGIAADWSAGGDAVPDAEIIVALGRTDAASSETSPTEGESFAIERAATDGGQTRITVSSPGERGLVYALLELADRVRYASDAAEPLAELLSLERIAESTATKVRSVSRMFVSEEEDKSWYYDRAFWDDYLTELAGHRFNRFNLALGMGYDYGHDPDIRDNYLYFAYPFLLSVPGYKVRAEGLPEGEERRNLETLRYIGEQVKLRGLDFHVGIWTHTYDLPDSPNPRYPITGLTKDNHAAYCRDALALLLEECPSIDGLTLRVHYESGIPEPAHAFWRVALSGIAACERTIAVDIHSKGVDFAMIRMVQETTGKRVTVSPKYWAEHLGLPYQQAANREREMPDADFQGSKYAAVTAGSRKVTRYGYADFMTESRDYDIVFRVWPGTQRFLLWGDPALAAGFGRAASFCGAAGLELFEPLAFKGRKTSGREGGRELYAAEELRLGVRDWRKYDYTYLLWGRLLYDPDADPSVWRRFLRSRYGDAADGTERALAYASRILPLVATAHHPSSANVDYWPELYTNLAVIRTKPSHLDYDLPEPKTFGAASPLDPAMFCSIDEYAGEAANGRQSRKVTPPEVSARLDEWASEALRSLAEAEERAAKPLDAQFRRMAADVRIMAELGRFFARKFRAGTGYALFERTNDARFAAYAARQYAAAKEAWERIVAAASGVYRADIAFGHKAHMRGDWADRLPAIEEDLEAVKRVSERFGAAATDDSGVAEEAVADDPGIAPYVNPARPECPAWQHAVPAPYLRGRPVEIAVTIPSAAAEEERASGWSVRLHYRRVNQAERFESEEMQRGGAYFSAVIPSSYTDSAYPIMYFFELRNEAGAWTVPGFDKDMTGVPYRVVRQLPGTK